jgi:hypothetical protein
MGMIVLLTASSSSIVWDREERKQWLIQPLLVLLTLEFLVRFSLDRSSN